MEPDVEVAIETSRREASLALARGADVLEDDGAGRPHASDLLTRLEALLARAGVHRAGGRLPLAAVHVGLGPGSYTGLRVGIAIAQALARASGARLHGLPSFEVLAFAALAPGEEAGVALDARGGRFYHARYRRTAGGLDVLVPPAALTGAELAERAARGGTLLAEPELSAAAGLPPGTPVRAAVRPTARALLELARARAAAGELVPAAALEPLYLARFGAAPGAR